MNMKLFTFVVTAALIVVSILFAKTFAASSPFEPYEEERFEVIEDMLGIGDGEFLPKVRAGYHSMRMAKAEFLAATMGGSAVVTALGVSIPASSMIVNTFYIVPENFVSASGNSVAIHCESADDIIAAVVLTALTGNGTASIAGAVVDYSTNSFISNGCELTATVGAAASGDITAGELEIYVEYVKSAAGAGVAD